MTQCTEPPLVGGRVHVLQDEPVANRLSEGVTPTGARTTDRADAKFFGGLVFAGLLVSVVLGFDFDFVGTEVTGVPASLDANQVETRFSPLAYPCCVVERPR